MGDPKARPTSGAWKGNVRRGPEGKARHRWSELAESREGKLGMVAHACNSRYSGS